MEEQKYILKNIKSFKLKDIFECGQCFRWNIQSNGSYIGVFKNDVLKVSQKENDIIFEGMCDGKIEEVVTNYFDLNRDYEKIKKQLAQEKVNNYLNSMKNIGISYELAVKYLQELGGQNGIS